MVGKRSSDNLPSPLLSDHTKYSTKFNRLVCMACSCDHALAICPLSHSKMSMINVTLQN